jgi:hypothetical protein
MCMRVICGPPVLSGCGSLSSGSKQPNETFIYLRCAPRDDGFADTARMRYQTRCCGERGEKLIAAHATGSLMLTQVQPANKARPFYFIYTYKWLANISSALGSEWVSLSLNIIERACVWCQPCICACTYIYKSVCCCCVSIIKDTAGLMTEQASAYVLTHFASCVARPVCVSAPVGKSRIIKMSRASHADDFSPSHFRGKIVWIYCCWLVINTSGWGCTHHQYSILLYASQASLTVFSERVEVGKTV